MTFLDLVHLSQRTSTVYDRARLDALVHELGEWAGRPVTDDDLRAAAGVHDRVRALIRTVGARLRRGSEGPRLTGTQALAVIGASFVSAPERWSAEAAALLEAADLPVHRGVRVFLTGCDHDHPAAYELVESLGAVVVGEDHDWGDLAGVGEIGTPGDVRSALVRLRAHGAPASAGHSAAVRAAQTARMARAAGAEFVVAWSRPFDDGPPWDVPVQRRALEEIGIPLVAVPAQPYGGGNDDEVRELLARALRDPARLPMGVLR